MNEKFSTLEILPLLQEHKFYYQSGLYTVVLEKKRDGVYKVILDEFMKEVEREVLKLNNFHLNCKWKLFTEDVIKCNIHIAG